MKPLISVIVPVYNVEKYINRCIDSILNQTYTETEIILVDDGSDDNSGTICDEYAARFKNISVFHKHNSGPSDTRNVGILNSNGAFIFFVDSDDYIIPTCLEILYKSIINYGADISCGSFNIFVDSSHLENNAEKKYRTMLCDGKKALSFLLYGKNFYTSSCNILIKKDIAEQNLFPTGKFHEDEMTTFRYFLSASKVVKVDAVTYYYYQREGSIMHGYGQPVLDELYAGDYYVAECKGRGLDKNIQEAALCKKYDLYVSTIEGYPELREREPEMYAKALTFIRDYSKFILFNMNTSFSTKRTAIKNLFSIKRK